jgi:hypothetical protein
MLKRHYARYTPESFAFNFDMEPACAKHAFGQQRAGFGAFEVTTEPSITGPEIK